MNFKSIEIIQFRNDPYFKWSARFCFGILSMCYFLLLFYWQRLPPVVPFFYSLPWGEEQLSSPFALILLITGAVFLYVLNALWALLIYKAHIFYMRILLISATLICVLTVITTVKIVFLIS